MENNTSKLTLRIGDHTVSWETQHTDLTVSDILWGLYGCLVGQTFFPKSVVNAMRDFVEEHSEVDDYEHTDGKFCIDENTNNHFPA